MSPLNLRFWNAIAPMVFVIPMACAVWNLEAQTIEQVTLYRDAALVSWKSEQTQGQFNVAKSQRAIGGSQVQIFQANGSGQLGVMEGSRPQAWSTEETAEIKGWDQELDALALELALRQAQLDLVEEDLGMLRANRNVGGTAESILVEDLEELSDWMHEAFRDALYRRVELREELAAMEIKAESLRAKRSARIDAQPHVFSVQWPDGQEGPVWANVVETEGAHWAPVNQVQVLEEGKAVWEQRGRFRVDLPMAVEVPVMFADENWPGFSGQLSDGQEQLQSASSSSPKASKEAGMPTSVKAWPDGGHWYAPKEALTLGQWPLGEAVLSSTQVPFRRHFVAIPKRSNVVRMQLSIPHPGLSVFETANVRLLDETGVPGVKPLSSSGDTLVIGAGVAKLWSVQRSAEKSLCSRMTAGNRIQHRRAFLIEVTNRSSRSGELTLIEPLPENRALEIEVAPEALDGGRLDERTESIVWSLNLKAGETRTLKFAYDVTHDKGVTFSEAD